MARFDVPDGWTMQAYRYALDPTPAKERALWSHAGAARFTHNHMLARAKAILEQRAAERTYGVAEEDLTPAQEWSLPALRRTWNRIKQEVAPWWDENSKEAYNTGLDSLARSLEAWSKSRKGERAGAPVGFPRFHSRRDRASVQFTTGTIRVQPDRRHVTLPRLGMIKTHESTRKLARRLEAGTARILSATVACDSVGRWHVAFQTLAQRCTARPAHVPARQPVIGVDVGVNDLLVIATPEGVEVDRIPAPRSLASAQLRLRKLQRKTARQVGPYGSKNKRKRRSSNRWRRTQARIGKIYAYTANVRRDALNKATTQLAQRHQIIAVETLNVSGMRSAGGTRKKGLNKALADAALAQVRRMLAYKTAWYGALLVEADQWFPSSKTCSECGSRKPRLHLSERSYACEHCGLILDRDLNAAINLARLGEARTMGQQSPAGSGPVAGRGATQETEPALTGDAAGGEASTRHRQQPYQPGTASPQGEAA